MFTFKSTSEEGIYYLVNHWRKYKTFWIKPEKLKSDMLFKSPSDAKRNLTKMLNTTDDYSNDKFELIEVNI